MLEEEDRRPNEEEKARLVRYVGWGQFAQPIFDGSARSRNAEIWRQERQALAELITAEEWSAARASTLNAHYTSEPVIRGIWQALEHLGFTGGRALEPAAGIGHFIGLTPVPLREHVAWTGVELDAVTGAIAKALYPGADIRIQGFETSRWPDSFFDLAISNVPFGDYGVSDRRYGRPAIHDYFFLKALDKLRPGGLLAFITSRYTLDKEDERLRRHIARRADFLGAIRLPGGPKGAFVQNAGTEVTTDIVFLRRCLSDKAPAEESWFELAEIETPDGRVAINRYFVERPQMMLGTMRLSSGLYSAAEPVLIGEAEGIEASIADAARHMAANAFIARGAARQRIATAPIADQPTDGIKDGAFYRRDGRIYRKIAGVGEPQDLSNADAARVTALIELRDVVNSLLAMQASGDGHDGDELRANLNRRYDAFLSRFGPINKTVISVSSRLRGDGTPIVTRRFPNFAAFRPDPDAFKVAATENYDEATESVAKAAIFFRDILQPAVEPLVSNAADALALSLNATGRVDLPLIAAKLEASEEYAIEALGERIWLDPAGDIWRTREDYLSGDVVGKLEDARAAASSEERYARNAEALEAVQPAPLTRLDITVLLGAPWVPIETYRAFLAEVIGIAADGLTLNPVTLKWQFAAKPAIPDSAKVQFATPRSSVPDIVLAALNNAEIRVMDPGPDPQGPPIYNAAASEEANAKVAAIRELFSGSAEAGVEGWVWTDEARAIELEVLYNRHFNRLVPTLYDGAHQKLPGIARYVTTAAGEVSPFALRQHQLNAVWRIVASGNTLLDHAVGAGKTFTMIATGMEQKRLGLIQRPLYVVPNHMLEQFSREFCQAYPAAKLLVADRASMARDNRRTFAARGATEDWDGIIITHDAFGRIPMSDAAYERHIRQELNELGAFKVRAAEEEGKSSPTVKELEKAAKRLEVKLAALINKERKDEGLTFEELGVDFLFIDEAQAFKNLAFRTRHTRVKGLAQSESQRATDLFLKLHYLDEKRPGRTAVFATGTPVSNSIAEMYTMQRYLQPGLLRDYGVDEFDGWAATFGDIVTQIELAPSGKGFRTVRSFSKFVNIPELIALYSRVADSQTADMLNLPRPRLRGGAVQIVEAQMSAREAAIMESLVARAEAIKGKRAEKGGDNMLRIMSEGLQLATDIRLLNPDAAPNPQGKIAKAADNIARIWREGEEPALAQLVFLDMGVPGGKSRSRPADVEAGGAESDVVIAAEGGDAELAADTPRPRFNLYEDLGARLMAGGIPRNEIAFIHDADNDEKKARLFASVRSGDIRILIGSTAKMGVGTNVQRRLTAMHHIDAPWRPADVEQRDGRILRQGNLNLEVEIYRYITLRSLDAYRWQTLNTKANFIAQLRAGARGVRTAEDIDSPVPEAAMIKAAATGDPRIMEHAELTREVRLLEAARRGAERSMAAARAAMARTLKRIEDLAIRRDAAKADADQLRQHGEKDFAITLAMRDQKIPVSDRKTAGAILKVHLLRSGARQWDASPLRMSVGELSGFVLSAALRRAGEGLQLAVFARGRLTYGREEYFALSEESDPVGLVRRFESLTKAIPKILGEIEKALAAARADLPRLERQLASPAFPRQDQLDAAKAGLLRLEKKLQPQTKERDAMKAADLNEEWQRLDKETKGAVSAVIEEAQRTGLRSGEPWRDGEIYAYPHPAGGIAWGVDGAAHNLHRGVAPVPANGLGHGDYLESLQRAGGDEAAFHKVFTKLSADPNLDDQAVAGIASIYCGRAEDWPERRAALGAIETTFYQQRNGSRAQSKHR